METETDLETETETDNTQIWTRSWIWTQTWTWNWNTYAKYLIWRNSSFSAVRVVADMAWRNFQWRCVLVASLQDENSDTKLYTAIGTALQTMC
jgi:hypothetical protein